MDCIAKGIDEEVVFPILRRFRNIFSFGIFSDFCKVSKINLLAW